MSLRIRSQVFIMGVLALNFVSACQSPATNANKSDLPVATVSALPSANTSPSTEVTASPLSTVTTNPLNSQVSNPSVSLPSEVSSDAALKQDLVKILAQILPNVKEDPLVSEITRKHALQIALNSKDTDFHVQANYQPVAASGLQIQILRSGIYPSDNLLSAYFSDSNREQLLQRFQKQISDSIGSLPYSHFGIEVLHKDSAWFLSFVVLTKIVSLENLSLNYSGPQNLTVKGKILNPAYAKPEGLVTRPDGKIEELKLTASGTDFELPLKLAQTGYYSFEINVEGPLGPQPATNFVLAVGVPYPLPDNEPNPSPTPLPALGLMRAQILELINQDRQSMGVAVLKSDSGLDNAAQSHSEEMIAKDYIGHNSPFSGTPQNQVNAAGVSELVAQNIAISRSLENAQRELMSSPGHRQTLINPNWTHVGLGVARSKEGFLYITQDFFQRQFELNPLPATVKKGETVIVKGRALKNLGSMGVFVNGAIQGDPIDLAKQTSFEFPVTFSQVGKQNIRVGLSEPPVDFTYQFIFYNNWDLEVLP
jgi:uncharacterized protein YkwD